MRPPDHSSSRCGSEHQSQTHDAACRTSPSAWVTYVVLVSLRIASQDARHRFSNRSSCLTFPIPYHSVQQRDVVASLSSAPVRRFMCWTNDSREMQHTVFVPGFGSEKLVSSGLRPNWEIPRQRRLTARKTACSNSSSSPKENLGNESAVR